MASSKTIDKVTAADFIPPNPTLESLREASKGCRGCPLYLKGTQTVFGEGPATARLMLVGEQPGNDEDLEGKPFVGPAGRVLNQALESAGLSRDETYVTNVVKHFKWEPDGKRRIHKKPNTLEIVSCRPWLDWEIELVEPEVLVCLGATAAQALRPRLPPHRPPRRSPPARVRAEGDGDDPPFLGPSATDKRRPSFGDGAAYLGSETGGPTTRLR